MVEIEIDANKYYVYLDGLNRWNNHKRRMKLISIYTNPRSKTFGNAYKSAMKAGFSDTYARVITTRYLRKKKMPELLATLREYNRTKNKVVLVPYLSYDWSVRKTYLN